MRPAATMLAVPAVVNTPGHPSPRSIAAPARIVGTPDVVVGRLRAYAAAGVTYVIPVFPYRYERASVRVFADRVIPAPS